MSQSLADTPGPSLNTNTIHLSDRKHRLGQPSSWLGRSALRAQDALENLVAKTSVHGDPMIYDTARFPWAAEIEAEWRSIRAELDQVMPFRDQIPSFHEILKEASTITTDQNWKTFFLAGVGMDCSGNARHCPATVRLLGKIPGMKTAFFSILAPHKHIPAHRGAYNGVLRYHLGLLIPEPSSQCRIRIGREIRHWSEGKSLIFDDSFNHEVWNDTDGYRVVLFVDFARPLRQPFQTLNEMLLNLTTLAPFLREAGGKQKKWEQNFYRDKKS